MIEKKTITAIAEEMEAYLRENTAINYFNDGSIAKAFINMLANSLGGYYDDLEFNTSMAFISKAKGQFLDLIGALLDCTRQADEGDDNYRYRIVHQVYTAANANETALRLKCLTIDNVKDIVMKPHVKGAGSFAIYLDVTDRNILTETTQAVKDIVDATKAFGVQGEVVTPRYISLDISCRLIFQRELTAGQRTSVSNACAQAIRNYIDSLSIGESFISFQVVRAILNTDTTISNVDIYRFQLDGRPATFAGRAANWDEQFIPGTIEVI